jgi:transposase
MRGPKKTQQSMLSLRTPEMRVPKKHPLRAIKAMADGALEAMSEKFDEMYSTVGRPSIPPEQLLKGSLLQALYSIRSERQLYRWFLDMGGDDETFDHSTFSANRDRFMRHDVGQQLFKEVVTRAKAENLLSAEHFSVDGSLIEAAASLKSFRKKDERPEDRPPPDDPGNPTVNFHGEKRSNETHESTTDPEARLARKSNGTTAKLSYCLNGMSENRNGLLVGLCVMVATGTAEREGALKLIYNAVPGTRRITVGSDKGYDTKDFVAESRHMNATPHIARKKHSALAERYAGTPGYLLSQRARKLIEEAWGWMKEVGGLRKLKVVGRRRAEHVAFLVGAAFNLRRMATLLPAA